MPETNISVTSSQSEKKPSQECLVLMDDTTWIWSLVKNGFETHECPYVRLSSDATIRHSWKRFKNAPCIVIHWESKNRTGGAIVEEILDIEPNYDVAKNIIILTTNPIHEDVVYFSELGIRRILRARNRDKELAQTHLELRQHIAEAIEKKPKATTDALWRKILLALDRLGEAPETTLLNRIEENIYKLRGAAQPAARDLDALGSVCFARGHHDEAFQYWQAALQNNPNYFRSYNNMIHAYRKLNKPQDAYQLMQKMQMLNRSSITRLVGMGETQLLLNDDRKAEHYFKAALEKDAWCSKALNGMADIKFRQGELEIARNMLEKSTLASRYASKLNVMGVEMVKEGHFDQALEHYSKAQYVLPQQEKGPQLFYNIGLCYSKWHKFDMAREFLRLALVKEPNYKKAQRLLEQIDSMYPTLKSAS